VCGGVGRGVGRVWFGNTKYRGTRLLVLLKERQKTLRSKTIRMNDLGRAKC